MENPNLTEQPDHPPISQNSACVLRKCPIVSDDPPPQNTEVPPLAVKKPVQIGRPGLLPTRRLLLRTAKFKTCFRSTTDGRSSAHAERCGSAAASPSDGQTAHGWRFFSTTKYTAFHKETSEIQHSCQQNACWNIGFNDPCLLFSSSTPRPPAIPNTRISDNQQQTTNNEQPTNAHLTAPAALHAAAACWSRFRQFFRPDS